MTSLIVSRPWARQPPSEIVLNAHHPLAPYVVGLWSGSAPTRIAGTSLTSSGISSGVNGGGRAVNFGSYSGGGIVNLPDNNEFRLVGVNGSLVVGASIGTLTSSTYPTLFAIRDGSTTIFNCVLGNDAGNWTGGRFGFGLAGVDAISTASSARQNETAVYGAEWGSNGRTLYINGRYNNTNSNTSTISSTTIQPSIGNRITGGRAFYGAIHFVFMFNINIGAQWQLSLFDNPWQLCAPRQIIVPYAAPSGYTHPTLSAATLVPAGGNTYQPRVSYTF
jgi:hypothetical protein